MGEVGSLAAGMARAFGMRVLYCNRNRLPAEQEQKIGAEFAEMERLLAESDFVSLHTTNIPANKGLIDAQDLCRDEADRVLHQHRARADR